MHTTTVGRSGLKISRIALGCMSFGTPRDVMPWTLDETAAQPIFRQALELGITFWDTANVYGGGTSEEIVGRAIQQLSSREQIVLATKIFWPMHAGPGGSGLSRKAVLEQVDASLRRLGTDYIDLLQIHRFDPDVPVDETMEALHDVVKAGKARYLGASSMWAWRFAKLQHAAARHGWTRFVSMQDQYSLLAREEEREMFGLLADQGVGSIPWSPLAGGRVTRPWGQAGSERAKSNPDVDMRGRPLWLDSDQAIVDAVQRISQDGRRVDGDRRHGVGASAPRRQRPDRWRHQTAPPHRRRRRPRHRAHRGRGPGPRGALRRPSAHLLRLSMRRRAFLRLALTGITGASIAAPLTACGSEDPQSAPDPDTPRTPRASDRRILLAYFSRPGENYWNGGRRDLNIGNTEVLANLISERVNCDTHRIQAADPYPDSYDDTVQRNVREQQADARPASPLRSPRSTRTARSCSPAQSGTSAHR